LAAASVRRSFGERGRQQGHGLSHVRQAIAVPMPNPAASSVNISRS
jgi:hypothetical protein